MTRCTKRTFKNYFFIRLVSLVVIIIWKGTFAVKSMNLEDNGLYPNFSWFSKKSHAKVHFN